MGSITLDSNSWKTIPGIHHTSREAMATVFEVYIIHEDIQYAQQAAWQAMEELDRLEHELSRFIENSDIYRINNLAPFESLRIGLKTLECLQLGNLLFVETNGAFDITIGPLAKAWGFRQKQGLFLDELQVDSLLVHTGFRKIEVMGDEICKSDSRIQIDFNAIAQGYTVDLIASYLESKNLHHYLIDVGGEIRTGGMKPGGEKWIIAIERPAQTDSAAQAIQQTIAIANKSIATSGNYRNYFVHDGIKYAHTINPKTGYPAHNSLLSVTVIANDCISADAYATAFMVMGLERTLAFLKNHPEIDVFLIFSRQDGSFDVKFSEGFQNFLTKL